MKSNRYGFGIDIGGTTIKTGLFREDGVLEEQWKIPTRVGENGRFIYDDIAALILNVIKEKGLRPEEISGAGVDIPCPVHGDGSIGVGANIRTTGGFPAKEISGRLGGLRVELANDANAAGLGELWMGAGRGKNSLCMVTLGTGVGGALVQDGKIIPGLHGTAGEIGHILVQPGETETCGCGGHGCLEQYASATGIVRVAKRIVKSGDPLISENIPGKVRYPNSALAAFGEGLSSKDVCDLAREGDELACRALDFSMSCLSQVLSAIAYVTDPEIYVIGGGVIAAGEVLLERIRKNMKHLELLKGKTPEIVPAMLGSDAGIYGAAALLL